MALAMPRCQAAFRPPSAHPRSITPWITCSGGEGGGRPVKQRGPTPPSAQRAGPLEGLPGSLRNQQMGNSTISAAPQAQPLSPAILLLVSGAGFATVAADVTGANGGLHLLQHLDASAHAWVSSSSSSAAWSVEVQKLVAGKLISDAAIVSGLVGWAGVAGLALQTRSPRLLQALAVSGAAYWAGGGRLWGSDPPLVDALKHAFQRVRPSEHHHTFAFPSGHTTAAAFVCGTLLFVLLPLALQALEQEQSKGGNANSSSSSSGSSGGPQAVTWLMERRWQLWAAGVGLTAFGRVLADVHWCSDTMAGACLGAALTACVAQMCGIEGLTGAVSSGQQEEGRQEGRR